MTTWPLPRSSPHLEAAVAGAEQDWGEVGQPEATRLQADIAATHRVSEVTTERLDRLQARAADRAVGVDRGAGL